MSDPRPRKGPVTAAAKRRIAAGTRRWAAEFWPRVRTGFRILDLIASGGVATSQDVERISREERERAL